MTAKPIDTFESALDELRLMAMMHYGGVMIATSGDELARRDAYNALIAFGAEVLASAIVSRMPADVALQITLEHLPTLLTDLVKQKKELMEQALADIERQGAPLQ